MDSLDVGAGNLLVWLEVEKDALPAGRGDPEVAVEEGLGCIPQPVSGTIVHVAGHSDNLCLLLYPQEQAECLSASHLSVYGGVDG